VFFYLSNQRREIGVESRFSTRETNPINPILEGMEAIENLFYRDRRILLWMENEGMVVAVRTSKITMRKEKH
jgi:hypothetical protein